MAYKIEQSFDFEVKGNHFCCRFLSVANFGKLTHRSCNCFSMWNQPVSAYAVNKSNVSKRIGKRLNSVLWQKPLHPQKNLKSKVTTQKRHQHFDYTRIMDRLRTQDEQLEWQQSPTCVVKPVNERSTFSLTATFRHV